MHARLTGGFKIYVIGEHSSVSPWMFNTLVERRDTAEEVVAELSGSK